MNYVKHKRILYVKLIGSLWSDSYQKTQKLVSWDIIHLINNDVYSECDDIVVPCKLQTRSVTLK